MNRVVPLVPLVSLLLAAVSACADPGTAPRPRAFAADKAPAASCAVAPVQALTVTPGTLTITAGQTATFTACTQYATSFTATSNAEATATVAATGSAGRDAEGLPYKQTFTVTAGATAAGPATITVTDRRGNVQTVQVNVVASAPSGVITFAPSSPVFIGRTETKRVQLSETGYAGGFTITGATSAGVDTRCFYNAPAAGTGGSVSCASNYSNSSNRTVLNVQLDPADPTVLLLRGASYGVAPGQTVTVTIGDALGNTAVLTVNQDNEDVITFAPSSPVAIGRTETKRVQLSEAGYTGGFTVAGATSAGVDTRCFYNPPDAGTSGSVSCASNYSNSSNRTVLNVQLDPADPTVLLLRGASYGVAPGQTVTVMVADALGHTARLTVIQDGNAP